MAKNFGSLRCSEKIRFRVMLVLGFELMIREDILFTLWQDILPSRIFMETPASQNLEHVGVSNRAAMRQDFGGMGLGIFAPTLVAGHRS